MLSQLLNILLGLLYLLSSTVPSKMQWIEILCIQKKAWAKYNVANRALKEVHKGHAWCYFQLF
jgi:hypothetical protein